MKLKRVIRKPAEEKNPNVKCTYHYEGAEETPMYECCSYCHYYQDGCCTEGHLSQFSECISIEKVCEDGLLSKAIEESFKDDSDFNKLLQAISGLKISAKTKSELNAVFAECLEQYKINITEDIGYSVSNVYEDFVDKAMEEAQKNGVAIEYPDSFCCRYFS